MRPVSDQHEASALDLMQIKGHFHLKSEAYRRSLRNGNLEPFFFTLVNDIKYLDSSALFAVVV